MPAFAAKRLIGFALASVQSRFAITQSSSKQPAVSSSALLASMLRCWCCCEIPPLPPHRPGYPGQFVGQRHGGFVMPVMSFKLQCPRSQAIWRGGLLGAPEHRAGTMNQQHAEVCIPTLANRAKPAA